MRILYCGPGEELYPHYTLDVSPDTECDTPLEFTEEEADLILKTQENADRVYNLVTKKLKEYYRDH